MNSTILFVTAYDPPTAANFDMAMRFSKHQDYRLLGTDATRQNLMNAIASFRPQSIFMMSHGQLHAIKDNNGKSALHAGDGPTMSGLTVFAWACWTGAQLGYDLSRAGANWWGYDCKITAPDDRQKYARIQANFFKLSKKLYASANKEQDVLVVLERLKQECKKSLASLDQAGAANDVEAFSIYSTCNQFWERLLVWQAGTAHYIRHPHAPSAYINI